MLSCKEVARLLSESMEEPLPLRRRMGLRFHLMMCRICRRYAKQIRKLESLLGLYGKRSEDPDVAAAEELSPEAKDRLRSALREA